MTVYKYFIRIALKNKGVIFSYMLIFFLLSIINGTNRTTQESNFIESRMNVGIIDNSNGELSKGLRSFIEAKNNIVEIIQDEDYIKEEIFLETVDAVIIIPEDFEEKVIQKKKSIELYRDDRKVESYQVENQINKFLIFANATYGKGQFDIKSVSSALEEEIDVNLIERNSRVKNINAEKWIQTYYNFTSYVIIAMYIAVIGLVMADFRDEKIVNRVRISSKKFLGYNKEIYLGQLTIAILITLAFVLGSIIVELKHIGDINLVKYLINIVAFSFSILCLTFLINNLTSNKFIINGISTVLSLGTSFISGVMVPQQFLGEEVLKIAKFFPTYYFIKVNEMDINSFVDIRYEIFMQILFALAFILMGLYFSKIQQRA